MTVIYTEHAKERMAERSITEKMVNEGLEHPDEKIVGHDEREVIFKKLKAGTIKIVCKPEGKHTIIISTIWHKTYEN
ncbi:MAG: DUF4258 domain-containing protein [Candidatus Paceibacterota bacterium]|jgi:hypothetical protein